jgi:iron complex outermembrane recepter protein
MPSRAPVWPALFLSCQILMSAAAQTVSAPAPVGSSGGEEDVVELSPFQVSSDRDVGYLATSSLAGSRFNTALKDTPAAISVLTPEFLADIGAFNLTEALSYAANVELYHDDDRAAVNGNAIISGYDSYRVRGMNASTARNYFVWSIPAETALVERIEDSRGPNSVLFGIASPGGLINANTKQARLGRAFRKGSFTVADRESWRAHLDLNQPLFANRLGARFNWVSNKNNHFRHWAFEEHNRGHVALTYRLTDRTRVRAEYERGQLDSNTPKRHNLLDRVLLWNSRGRPTFGTAIPAADVRTANGLAQNSTAANQPRVTYFSNADTVYSMRSQLVTTGTSTVIKDMSLTDYSINVGGPGQDRSSRFNALSAFVEHQFSKTMFVEVAYNHQDHIFDRYDARGDDVNGLKGDPHQFLPTGAANPNAGRLFLESAWTKLYRRDVQDTGRITFSQAFDANKWGNYRVAALGEYEKAFVGTFAANEMWVDSATGRAAFNPTPENAQNNVWRRTYVTERDWASYYIQGPNRRTSLQGVRDPTSNRTLSARWILTNPAETYTTRKALMLATQARYFSGRLVIAAGVRRDDLDEFQQGRRRDPVTQEWVHARNPAETDPGQTSSWNSNVGRTKTAGLVYHLTPRFSVFYNRADNLELPGRGAMTLPADGTPGNPIPVPAPKGEGEDFGAQFDLLEGKLFARATYYQTKGRNQATTFSNPTRQANTRILDALQSSGVISQAERDMRNTVGGQGLFDHESEGIEFQVTANLLKNWRLQFNVAETDAKETNKFLEWLAWEQQNLRYIADLNSRFPARNVYNIMTSARSIRDELDFIRNGDNALGEQTESSGLGKLGNRRYKVSAFTRYTFTSGLLRGAYIGGGYKHQSKMFIGLHSIDNRKLYGNSFWSADALAGYTVRGLPKGRALSFQLNVANLFNQRKPLLMRYASDNASVLREIVVAPTTWRFTTNVEF